MNKLIDSLTSFKSILIRFGEPSLSGEGRDTKDDYNIWRVDRQDFRHATRRLRLMACCFLVRSWEAAGLRRDFVNSEASRDPSQNLPSRRPRLDKFWL